MCDLLVFLSSSPEDSIFFFQNDTCSLFLAEGFPINPGIKLEVCDPRSF